jgi:alpha-2-macroglobulin
MKISLSILRCTATVCVLALLLPIGAASAEGGAFFLLADASYGKDEVAMVRLEAQDLDAVREYGGADVYVYRIAKPVEFLSRQKNLHRIDVEGNYSGTGLGNALSRLWDRWWIGSRDIWRTLFTKSAREAVTAQAPETTSHPESGRSTPLVRNPAYRKLAQHELVDSFRYPVNFAKPIEPPAGLKLAGSSSEFIRVAPGNVMIPLGKRAPGLYLVEAMVGDYRATALVFVSDSIALTKISARQMLVWVAGRRDGKPQAGARALWTDGVGVLKSGATDARGLVAFERAAPEKTYVFGEDRSGGVFISENYYYDSEIYDAKLYAVTDRPLYRPGDEVFVKFAGRSFRSARDSSPLAAGELQLSVADPNGFPVATQTLRLSSETGADTSFRLPENAVAGGYELRFVYQGANYGAAFRVADYQKPHFEIHVLPEKRDYKTGEEIKGRIQLAYPDGKPVTGAAVELMARAQRLTMIEGDLGYSGQFPVKLSSSTLKTDASGNATFVLPAATEPSRYVLSVLATDGAAYRVRFSRELLIERGAGSYQVRAERAFSAPGEKVVFGLRALAAAETVTAAAWEWVRLEDRKRDSGALGVDGKLVITFPDPGSYTVSLRDAAGNIVGATPHFVSGPGARAPQGSIEIVFDKPRYRPGETAHVLVTFPQVVGEALLTLERDRVEKTALLNSARDWVGAHSLSPEQWRFDLPVGADYGPNITFSVAYVKDGEYTFQNHGIRVEIPRVELAVSADKAIYAPGDTVTLNVDAQIGGKPAAGALVTLGVVDEMIYVLQPEIAPDIFDFFHHPRRNNVRTAASLGFIGYDLATPPLRDATPARRETRERAIKILERPRREDIDTAYWNPSLRMDANGRARVSFRMPDSLTRWRVTARALNKAGVAGQNTAYLRSDKSFYLKWTSPNWMRAQDAPAASVLVFNQSGSEAKVEFAAAGAGVKHNETLNLKPGANFVRLPLDASKTGDTPLSLKLSAAGTVVDSLDVALRVQPVAWQSVRSLALPLIERDTELKLPADATNVRVQLADSASLHFRRVLDDLIDYPYGCVEQTASRLLPFSIALKSVRVGEDRLAATLAQRLHGYRFRLAQMAGPQAVFGWWSAPSQDGDALLTAYAYYADWHASGVLALKMPDGHWDRLLEVYRIHGEKRLPWERALMLSWMSEMGLPVISLVAALAEELANERPNGKLGQVSPLASLVMDANGDLLSDAMARLLTAHVLRQLQASTPQGLTQSLETAEQTVLEADVPLGDALLILSGHMPASEAQPLLERVRGDMPTIDRALTLVWLQRVLGGAMIDATAAPALAAPWKPEESVTGQRAWRAPIGQATISLAGAPQAGLLAVVQYESREAEKSSLPLHLERRLYRMKRLDSAPAGSRNVEAPQRGEGPRDLTAAPSHFELELLAVDSALKTDEVYLDEIVLKRTGGSALHFGVIEVPLPPGASVERGTWGISVRFPGGSADQAIARASNEPAPHGYAVPVETIDGEVVVRHLLRVAQRGSFVLPPVRYYRMYQPEGKVFEERPRARLEIR